MLAGSNAKAEWKCSAGNLDWQAYIKGRVHYRAGCPRCSRANKVIQSQLTFLEAQPACLAQCTHERNDAEVFYPDNITLGSDKQGRWVCPCRLRGHPHRWTEAPKTCSGRGDGCGVCIGRQACANSLESLFPLIAAELDVNKNGFGPSEITACLLVKEVWWRSAKCSSCRQAVDV